MAKYIAGWFAALLMILLWVVAIIGWMLNIWKLIEYTGDIGTLFIMRIVGIFFAPIGVLLGWLV